MTTATLTRATRNAIEKHGRDLCAEAYRLHIQDGEGASTVTTYLSLPNATAGNAAINAGRELATGSRQP